MFRAYRFALLAGLILAASPGLAEDPVSPVVLERPDATFSLTPHHDLSPTAATARVPATRADGFDGVLEVTTAIHDGQLIDEGAFKVEFEAGRHDRLLLTVPLSSLPQNRAGDYTLTLGAGEPSDDWSVQDLKLSYPESVLVTPPAFVVDCRDLLDPCGSRALPSLRLRIKQGVLPLDAQVDMVEGPFQGGRNVSGQATFGSAKRVLEGVMALPISSFEHFPLGRSTAKLSVRAPGLQAQDVELEVTMRLPSLLLLVAAILGIAAGFVIRVLLQRWMDNSLARVEIGRIAARIEAETANSRDVLLQSTLEALAKQLSSAMADLLQHSDPARRTGASALLQEIQKKIDKAVADADARVLLRLEEVRAMGALLKGRWLLPTDAEASRAQALIGLDHIGQKLEHGALEEASFELESLREDTMGALTAAWQSFKAARGKLAEIRKPSVPLPESVAAEAAKGLARLEALWAQDPSPTGADDAALRRALDLLHGGRQVLEALLQSAGDGTLRTVELCAASLGEVDVAEGSWEAALAQAAELVAPVRVVGAANDPAIHLQAWCEGLRDSLAEATRTLRRAIEGETPSGVTTLLEAGRYVAAAGATATLLKPGGAPLGEGDATVPDEVQARRVADPDHPREAATQLVRPGLLAARRIAVNAPRAVGDVVKGELLQTLLSAVGLVGLAYVVFEPGWVGTARDWAAVFSWGFALDLGVGTFASEAKSRLAPKVS